MICAYNLTKHTSCGRTFAFLRLFQFLTVIVAVLPTSFLGIRTFKLNFIENNFCFRFHCSRSNNFLHILITPLHFYNHVWFVFITLNSCFKMIHFQLLLWLSSKYLMCCIYIFITIAKNIYISFKFLSNYWTELYLKKLKYTFHMYNMLRVQIFSEMFGFRT